MGPKRLIGNNKVAFGAAAGVLLGVLSTVLALVGGVWTVRGELATKAELANVATDIVALLNRHEAQPHVYSVGVQRSEYQVHIETEKEFRADLKAAIEESNRRLADLQRLVTQMSKDR